MCLPDCRVLPSSWFSRPDFFDPPCLAAAAVAGMQAGYQPTYTDLTADAAYINGGNATAAQTGCTACTAGFYRTSTADGG